MSSCLSGGCVALGGCLTVCCIALASLLIIVSLGIIRSVSSLVVLVGSSVVVLAFLLCLAILGGLSIGIGIGISISIASGSRTVVVLGVSGPSTGLGTGLGVLRSCGGSLSSLGALLALGVTVRDGNVGRGA